VPPTDTCIRPEKEHCVILPYLKLPAGWMLAIKRHPALRRLRFELSTYGAAPPINVFDIDDNEGDRYGGAGRPMWCLLSRCPHSATCYWKHISFWSHFPDSSWTLTNLHGRLLTVSSEPSGSFYFLLLRPLKNRDWLIGRRRRRHHHHHLSSSSSSLLQITASAAVLQLARFHKGLQFAVSWAFSRTIIQKLNSPEDVWL